MVALDVRVPVEQASDADLERNLAVAVGRAAEQLTGRALEDLQKEAPNLLVRADELVVSYGFAEQSLLTTIDRDALITRLADAGLDVWQGERPRMLVWLTEEVGLLRQMIGVEPHPLADAIETLSERFGLTVVRPLMDLEDALAISPAQVWGGFSSVVREASARYGAEHVLVIGDRPDRGGARLWLYRPDQGVEVFEVQGETLPLRMAVMVNPILDYAKRWTVRADLNAPSGASSAVLPLASMDEGSGSEPIRIRISFTDSTRLMDFLDHLDAPNSGIRVAEMQLKPQVAEITLETQYSLDALDRFVSKFADIRFLSPLSYALN